MRDKIMKMPKWLVVVIAVVITVGFIGALKLGGFLVGDALTLPAYGDSMLGEFVGGVFALLMLILFGYAGILKEKNIGTLKTFYTGGFFIGYCILEIVAQMYVQAMKGNTAHVQPVISIIFFAATMFLIGWTEEIVFRGVILNMFLDSFSKTKRGILGAILLNGVLFGALHMSNVLSGVKLESAIVQSITAGLLGVILAAVYARTRSIWYVICAHAAVDFAGLMASGIFGIGTEIDGINDISWTNLISVPVLIIPIFVLLRKSKLAEMEQRANGMVVFDTYEQADGMATTSLILGVLSIITGFVGYGIGLGVVGILGSVLSKKIKPYENGVATAGMVTSIIGIVIGVLMAVVLYFMYLSMQSMGMENIF